MHRTLIAANRSKCYLGKFKLNRFDLYRAVRNELSRIWLIYQIFAKRNGARLVTSSTDLVVEGFPRSANSFIEAAIRHASPTELKLGHHTHARSQVDEAVRQNIPCVVLIRNPIDAIVSYLEESERLSSPNVLIREYIIFYNGIERHLGRIVFAKFDTIKHDPSAVIKAINSQFGMTLDVTSLKTSSVDQILECMTEVAVQRVGIVPAYRREAALNFEANREQYRAELKKIILNSGRPDSIRRAEEIYRKISKIAI